MKRKGVETSSFRNKSGPKALERNASGRSKGLVRMRSAVRIRPAAPVKTKPPEWRSRRFFVCLYLLPAVWYTDREKAGKRSFDKQERPGVAKQMILLLTGASHTGKTALAQKLLEKYKYPYFSIDHLKMGLIRSGATKLTPEDDDELTGYLWPIVREMVKTAIENRQNLIVEGCYIPFDWAKDFDREYLEHIKYCCLVMSEDYIKGHFADIKGYANVIENRLNDEWCTVEHVLEDNARFFELAQRYHVNYILIQDRYEINLDLSY